MDRINIGISILIFLVGVFAGLFIRLRKHESKDGVHWT